LSNLPETPTPKHDPFAALRQPNFLLFVSSRMFSQMGSSLLQAVMAWQVAHIGDSIAHSALNLGFLGLARFVPALGISLIGGAVADTHNRRHIIIASQSVPLICSILLALATFGHWQSLELIFGLTVIMGFASAFEGPARTSILPTIVRPETFSNAVTVGSTLGAVGMVSGPALAGLAIEAAGMGTAYAVFSIFSLGAILPIVLLRYKQSPGERRGVNLAAVKEGINFVRKRQVLLGAMSLDMFAVIFGGAQALLPIYASDILHVGAAGYGILSASSQAGAFAMSLLLVARPPVKRTGRALLYAVMVYGVFTMAFGLSRSFPLSIAFFMMLGAADQISVVMRHTTIQMSTPDELRGRVSAVNQVFIGASTQVGAMESGFVAALTGATFSVVSGGFGAVLIAMLIAWRMPQLFNFRLGARQPGSDEAAAVPVESTIDVKVEGMLEKPASVTGVS